MALDAVSAHFFVCIFFDFSDRSRPLVPLAESDRSQLDTLQYEQ